MTVASKGASVKSFSLLVTKSVIADLDSAISSVPWSEETFVGWILAVSTF